MTTEEPKVVRLQTAAAAERIESLKAKYEELQHGMQTGIGMMVATNPNLFTPKHARVGIDTALVSHGTLVQLLINKGLITELEYWETAVSFMRAEVERNEAELSGHYGTSIHLH